MLIKKHLRKAIWQFFIIAILYQILWQCAFWWLFHHDVLLANAQVIILFKLTAELALYLFFTLYFIILTRSDQKRIKLLIYCPMVILCAITLHACMKYL